MKVDLIIPIDVLRGKLRQDGFYFRLYKGQQIVQRCPDRRAYKATAVEKANQVRFGRQAQVVGQMQRAGSKLSKSQLWQLAAQAV